MKGHNRQHGGISSSFKRTASGAALSACVLAAGQAGAAEITLPPTSVTAAL